VKRSDIVLVPTCDLIIRIAARRSQRGTRIVLPHDPIPAREDLERAAREDRFLFWIDDGQPVSMAGIARRLKT
jgi:hypothetical protein